MIIGTVSFDPEKVLYAEIKLDRGKWVLYITQSISDTGAIDLEAEFAEYEEAVEALSDVDTAVSEARSKAKKAERVGFDAVGVSLASDDLSETLDDLECAGKIGF